MEKKFRDLIVDNLQDSKVILLGVPYDKNASVGKGACLAPQKLRELSFDLPALTMDGQDISACKIYDVGDVSIDDEETCETYFNRVHQQVFQNLTTHKFNLIFGGDHSIAIASERAFIDYAKKMGKCPVIIHIDAHPDICDTYHNSKYSHACPNRRALEYGLKDEDLVLIGIRGYEKQEVEFFKTHPNIEIFNASYLNKVGIDDMLLDIKSAYKEDCMVYVSYDIDANDPAFAPGTGTPEAFGLNSQTTLAIIKYLIKHLNVVAMDMVEIAPPLDCNDMTSWLGLKTLYEVLGVLLNK